MHYAVAGGWFLERKDFPKFDRAFCDVVRRFGFPTALTCGHMPGCEKLMIEWAGLMLVDDVTIIDDVMPTNRAQLFFKRSPQMLLLFSSGSPTNIVLSNFLTARGIPVVDVKI